MVYNMTRKEYSDYFNNPWVYIMTYTRINKILLGGDLMTKKLFVPVLIFVLVFSIGFGYAETEGLVVEEDLSKSKDIIEDGVRDVEEFINLFEGTTTRQSNIVDYLEVDGAIEEVIGLDEDSVFDSVENIYLRGKEKLDYITNVVEKQYKLKKQFVKNTREVYKLTSEIQVNLKKLALEMKDLIKDVDRTMDKEDYADIGEALSNLKNDIKTNEYIAGNVAMESRRYINFVRNREFINANRSFEKLVDAQEKQINLLKNLNNNISDLRIILENI